MKLTIKTTKSTFHNVESYSDSRIVWKGVKNGLWTHVLKGGEKIVEVIKAY